ncbi:hypothetical protein ACIBSW_35095 [Actinoplanes sp. NPDC049668]|uniref:hypothetical protein n=1 Tax=unclassified Actinoplanes TaxID=2626549 RepID=UPI0033B5BBE2
MAGDLLVAPAAGLGIGGGALLALEAGRDRAGYNPVRRWPGPRAIVSRPAGG